MLPSLRVKHWVYAADWHWFAYIISKSSTERSSSNDKFPFFFIRWHEFIQLDILYNNTETYLYDVKGVSGMAGRIGSVWLPLWAIVVVIGGVWGPGDVTVGLESSTCELIGLPDTECVTLALCGSAEVMLPIPNSSCSSSLSSSGSF